MSFTALFAVVALAVTGCSSAAEVSEPVPTSGTSAPTVPAGGQTLAQLGITNGPVDRILVPQRITVEEVVDQPNVITLVVSQPGGAELAGYLRTQLPAAGWTITADANDSLLFTGFGWDGAYTTSPQGWSGLTVRQQK